MTNDLMSLSQIARELGVTPSALSNWRTRYSDFPQEKRREGASLLFSLIEVKGFVGARGLGAAPSSREEIVDLLLDALVETSNKRKRDNKVPTDEVAAFVLRTVGELRNEGIETLIIFQFISAVAVEVMAHRKQLDLPQEIRDLVDRNLDDVRGWIFTFGPKQAHQNVTQIDVEIRNLWLTSLPSTTPEELANVIYGALQWQSGIAPEWLHGTSISLASLIVRIAPGRRVLNIGSGLGFIGRAYGLTGAHVTGQEVNRHVVVIHELMAHLEGFNLALFREDARSVYHPEWQMSPFDAVVSNAPINLSIEPSSVDVSDPRWRALSDFRSTQLLDYFIESAIAYLRPSSDVSSHRAVIAVPPSWLFSEKSARMRNYLVRNDYVESVIQLGSRVSANSSHPLALLVLSKIAGVRQAVRMIDARELGQVDRVRSRQRVREFSQLEIENLCDTLNSENLTDLEAIKSVDVPTSELRTERVFLDPARYISMNKAPIRVDEAAVDYLRAAKETAELLRRAEEGLRKSTPEALAAICSTITEDSARRVILNPKGIDQGLSCSVVLRSQGEDWTDKDFAPDDVIVSLVGSSIGAVVTGREFLRRRISWPKVAILRSENTQKVLQHYLLVWSIFGGLRQFLDDQRVSSTMPSLGRRVFDDVSVPVPPLRIQQELSQWAQPLLDLMDLTGFDPTQAKSSDDRPNLALPPTGLADVARLVEAASSLLQASLGPVMVLKP